MHFPLFINQHAVIMGTITAIELMSTNGGGRGGVVINVSSMAGECSNPVILSHCNVTRAGIHPTDSAPIYCASKTGVVGYTRSMKVS